MCACVCERGEGKKERGVSRKEHKINNKNKLCVDY